MSVALSSLVQFPKPVKPRRERGDGSIWQRGRIWWIAYYGPDGQKIRESTHTDIESVARRRLKRRLAEREAGTLPDRYAEKILVSELAVDLLNDYRNQNQNIRFAEFCWKHLEPHFGNVRASGVSKSAVNDYIQFRQDEGAKPGTINRDLSILRRMFTLAAENDPPKVLRVPPFPKHLPESDAREGFIEVEQYLKLCEHSSKQPWLHALLAVGYSLGFRKGEMLDLRVSQVDLGARSIRLLSGNTKNGRPRTAPMTDEVHQLLSECVKDKSLDDFVFTRANGKPVGEFRKTWATLTKAAGLSGLMLHDLRRSAVRNMIRNGVPEVVAMRISGHITRNVFDRYNIVSSTDLTAAAEKIGAAIENGHKTGTMGAEQKANEVLSV